MTFVDSKEEMKISWLLPHQRDVPKLAEVTFFFRNGLFSDPGTHRRFQVTFQPPPEPLS